MNFEKDAAVPWLKRIAAGLSQRSGFNARKIHGVFVVKRKVTLGQNFFFVGVFFPPVVSFHQFSSVIHSSATESIEC